MAIRSSVTPRRTSMTDAIVALAGMVWAMASSGMAAYSASRADLESSRAFRARVHGMGATQEGGTDACEEGSRRKEREAV